MTGMVLLGSELTGSILSAYAARRPGAGGRDPLSWPGLGDGRLSGRSGGSGRMPPTTGHGRWWVIRQGRTCWCEQHVTAPTYESTRGEPRTKVYASANDEAGAKLLMQRLVDHMGATVGRPGR